MLEDFFTMPKKGENGKRNNKLTANKLLANPDDGTEPELTKKSLTPVPRERV